MNTQLRPPIDKLLRGVSTGHVETVRDAWRLLLLDPVASTEAARSKLAGASWAENPRGPLGQYLGVLLSLLDELDPAAFRTEVERLQRAKLHPMHHKTVEMMARRAFDAPATFVRESVPVFVAPDIAQQDVVVANIEKWSQTNGLSLNGVTRIDVIARQTDMDYLGRYNLFFSGIILTWPADRPRRLRLLYQRLRAEFTFYHEVGHHVSGHVEGGSVAEQEDEADAYASRMMYRAHPILLGTARAALLPFKPLIKTLVARAEARNGG